MRLGHSQARHGGPGGAGGARWLLLAAALAPLVRGRLSSYWQLLNRALHSGAGVSVLMWWLAGLV